MAKPKLDPLNLLVPNGTPPRPAAPRSTLNKPAKRAGEVQARAALAPPRPAVEAFVAAGAPSRRKGRPPTPGQETIGVMVYLQPSTHESLKLGARLGDSTMSAIVEKLAKSWISANAETIEKARAMLDSAQMAEVRVVAAK